MEQARDVASLRAWTANIRAHGETIALVPTMGALHDGHLRLVECARVHADRVVLSSFVNPLQFGPGEDLSSYPRETAGDLKQASERKVDLFFSPHANEVYPRGPRVFVEPAALVSRWEGALRTGHFRGVATVVLKLLNMVQPDVTVFGQKDFQQAVLIRAMIQDLNFPVKFVLAPIVRDEDGLALSSRNVYLNDVERRRALAVPRAVVAVSDAFNGGERNAAALRSCGVAVLTADDGVVMDYLDIVHPESLEPIAMAEDGSVVLAAGRVGRTRLLDNAILARE